MGPSPLPSESQCPQDWGPPVSTKWERADTFLMAWGMVKERCERGRKRMVEDIPKSTGKQPKYPEAPLLFISGTHCSWKRRRIFCQGLGQQASLFCHSRRLWAEGSSPLWQDFHRGDNQLRLGLGFRWNCVSVSLGPGFGWNCVSASLGPGFRWNCISAPRCPFAVGGARQSVIILGSKKQTLPRLLIYLFAEGDKYH